MNFTVPQTFATLARERESESDDEVLQNIPADMVALWNRVKKSIRATSRMSRTEAFMKYAEEHEAETVEALERNAERMIAAHVTRGQCIANDDIPDRLYLVKELCEMFGTTRSRLVTLEKYGVIPRARRHGRRIYTRDDALMVRAALLAG